MHVSGNMHICIYISGCFLLVWMHLLEGLWVCSRGRFDRNRVLVSCSAGSSSDDLVCAIPSNSNTSKTKLDDDNIERNVFVSAFTLHNALGYESINASV